MQSSRYKSDNARTQEAVAAGLYHAALSSMVSLCPSNELRSSCLEISHEMTERGIPHWRTVSVVDWPITAMYFRMTSDNAHERRCAGRLATLGSAIPRILPHSRDPGDGGESWLAYDMSASAFLPAAFLRCLFLLLGTFSARVTSDYSYLKLVQRSFLLLSVH
jgi:hypothetical protein